MYLELRLRSTALVVASLCLRERLDAKHAFAFACWYVSSYVLWRSRYDFFDIALPKYGGRAAASLVAMFGRVVDAVAQPRTL
jgi:hypothetical protein